MLSLGNTGRRNLHQICPTAEFRHFIQLSKCLQVYMIGKTRFFIFTYWCYSFAYTFVKIVNRNTITKKNIINATYTIGVLIEIICIHNLQELNKTFAA